MCVVVIDQSKSCIRVNPECWKLLIIIKDEMPSNVMLTEKRGKRILWIDGGEISYKYWMTTISNFNLLLGNFYIIFWIYLKMNYLLSPEGYL